MHSVYVFAGVRANQTAQTINNANIYIQILIILSRLPLSGSEYKAVKAKSLEIPMLSRQIDISNELVKAIRQTGCDKPYTDYDSEGAFYYCSMGKNGLIGYKTDNCDTYFNMVSGKSRFYGAQKQCKDGHYERFQVTFQEKDLKKIMKRFDISIPKAERKRRH